MSTQKISRFALQGITVESICDTLREFSLIRELSHDQQIYIVCGIQSGHFDTIEVLIVSHYNSS
jgi:hypothetical protein